MSLVKDPLSKNSLRSIGRTKLFPCIFVWVAITLVASAQTVTTLHNFTLTDGALPQFVTLAQGRDGNIYGSTVIGGTSTACGPGCGTVFKVTPKGTLTSVSFGVGGTEGANPESGLALGTNGFLYGTTNSGGASGNGEVFSLNPKTKVVTVLHSFTGSDGANPEGSLTLGQGGKFYGVTSTGGANNFGTVFSISPSGSFTSLHSFSGTDGANPVGGGLVLGFDGAFYGVTYDGGVSGVGNIFKITSSGIITNLYNFDGSAGANPYGPLLLGADGNLYGTTNAGGQFNLGTVFQFTQTGILTILHNFDLTDGASPEAGLVQATDGNLYGTTFFGGAHGEGTIFSITSGGTFATLYSFPSLDGSDPGANPYALMQHTNGKFYATTNQGGPSTNCNDIGSIGCGAVFSFDVGLGPFVKFVFPSGKVGSVVQILGTALSGASGVSFDGVPASFKVISATFITATVPAGAATGRVTVTTPAGNLTSNVKFKVLP